MTYRVELSSAAERELRKLPPHVRAPLEPHLDALAHDPRPPGSKKLAGFRERYRIRVGEYRVIYEVQDQVLLVLVVRIAHRRDAYR